MSSNKLIEKIAIIHGGKGPEKEVSYKTSFSLQNAMKNLGFSYSLLEADDNLSQNLREQKITKAVLAVHGQYGEDGTLQGLLEYLKIPYTGAGVLASSVCMDKVVCKKIIQSLNILTPNYCSVTKNSLKPAQTFLKQFGLPLVVKPSRGGSSLATFIIRKKEEYEQAINEALQVDSEVLIEQYIKGVDIAIPFFANNFLCPIKIRAKEGFYDYKNKYTAGCTDYEILNKPNEEKVNTALSEDWKNQNLSSLAKGQQSLKQIIQFLNIRHYGRADFILTEDDQMYMLEMNTLPGFTDSSLITKAGQKENLSIENMLSFLIDNASLDYL